MQQLSNFELTIKIVPNLVFYCHQPIQSFFRFNLSCIDSWWSWKNGQIIITTLLTLVVQRCQQQNLCRPPSPPLPVAISKQPYSGRTFQIYISSSPSFRLPKFLAIMLLVVVIGFANVAHAFLNPEFLCSQLFLVSSR